MNFVVKILECIDGLPFVLMGSKKLSYFHKYEVNLQSLVIIILEIVVFVEELTAKGLTSKAIVEYSYVPDVW